MNGILKYIQDNNEENITCYSSRKFSLDENIKDTVGENSDADITPQSERGVVAEDDPPQGETVTIPDKYINNKKHPWFKYFLDGSRHVYKVDDMTIGEKIYPVLAGQYIVGCCRRDDRDTFKKDKLTSKIVLSLPKCFYTKRGKAEDFAADYCNKLNEYLRKENKFFASHPDIQVDKIVFYDIDKLDEQDQNKYRNSGISKIQNEMTDEEQRMVSRLCKEKKLNDDNWLIKDGSLQYNPRYSNMERSDFNAMRTNYQRVVGVSKSFKPDLLKNSKGEKMALSIIELEPFTRTKAYVYKSAQSDGQKFAIWYLRLRKSDFKETPFSDIIKCEKVLMDENDKLSSDDINSISANLIQEAYPVCYGKDTRWANHLYPVYLTETFCKSNYLSDNIFLSLF